ncbi:hypothetical protein YC2023_089086 [Brassica napus]
MNLGSKVCYGFKNFINNLLLIKSEKLIGKFQIRKKRLGLLNPSYNYTPRYHQIRVSFEPLIFSYEDTRMSFMLTISIDLVSLFVYQIFPTIRLYRISPRYLHAICSIECVIEYTKQRRRNINGVTPQRNQ